MTGAASSRRTFVALAMLSLLGCVLVTACGGASKQEISKKIGGAGLDPGVQDGSAGTPAPVTGDVYYWNGPETSGNETYRLLIGDNFHAVSGCDLKEFNEILAKPFNRPQAMLERFARMKNQETGALYPVRAGFSCDEEPGALPLASTVLYLDGAGGRYYFPTGADNEYYSFTDGDECLNPLRTTLFKLDERIGSYWWNVRSGKPPASESFKEIPLSCDRSMTANSTYRIYADRDFKVPTSSGSGDYVVVEVKDGASYAYLPVRQINGADVAVTLGLLENWLGLPHIDPLPTLFDAPGLKGGDESETFANIEKWKANRRFWEVCLNEPNAPATACTPRSFVYGFNGIAASSAVTKYREELRIDGTTVSRAVESGKEGIEVASYPFSGCDGMLEATFGLSRDPTSLDRRSWAMLQSRLVAASPELEPRFRCPTAANDRVCRLALGGAQGANMSQKYSLRQIIDLIDSAYRSCSAQQRTDLLEITLNSPVDVILSPFEYLSLGSFRAMSIKSASGTNVFRFREQCSPTEPCMQSGSVRTKPVLFISPSSSTRSLTVDHIAFQYMADNLASPGGAVPDASFFNLYSIFLRAVGTSDSRLRIVLADSSVGADPDSPRFLSQAVAASFADVFVVRSILQGTGDPTSAWDALAVANSLVVLDGRPSPSSPTFDGAPLTALRSPAGGFSMSTGTNDVLAVKSIVDGILVANASSQSTWIDSTLNRPFGREAIHFTGTESSGFPALYTMMWTGARSQLTNFQDSLFVPVVQFDPGLAAVPRVTFAREVKFMDSTPSGLTEVGLEALKKTRFCDTKRGSVQLLNGLNQRCPLM